jgi:hypothetical protein
MVVAPRPRRGARNNRAHLARLDASPGLATVLSPGRPVQRATLRVARTLYDGLRPAALFDALGSQPKELVLVLAPDADARAVVGCAGQDGRVAGSARAAARRQV